MLKRLSLTANRTHPWAGPLSKSRLNVWRCESPARCWRDYDGWQKTSDARSARKRRCCWKRPSSALKQLGRRQHGGGRRPIRPSLTADSGPPVYSLAMQDDIDRPGRFKILDWCMLAGFLGAMGMLLVLIALMVG